MVKSDNLPRISYKSENLREQSLVTYWLFYSNSKYIYRLTSGFQISSSVIKIIILRQRNALHSCEYWIFHLMMLS